MVTQKTRPPSLKKKRLSSQQSVSKKKRDPQHASRVKKERPAQGDSFSPSNSAVRYQGNQGSLLVKALKTPLPRRGEQHYAFTHGFHAYPGRFHPKLVWTLLQRVTPTAGFKVFDPFMGGGTTLVEGMCQGLEVAGNDLNPMAAFVARERCRLRDPSENREVLYMVKQLRQQIIARQSESKKKIVRRTHVSWLRSHYAPHLFVELLYWIDAIDKLPQSSIQETLRTVFSDLVFKFSNQSLITPSAERKTPPLPKGAVSRWMVARTEELLKNQNAFYRKIPKNTKGAQLFSEDFAAFNGLPESTVDLIITSPPAPGNWDYYQYHLLQFKWLKLAEEALKNHETGTKRRQSPKQWKQPFQAMLLKMRKMLKPGGSCYLVISDWLDREVPVDALAYLQKFAPSVGWNIEGSASVQRQWYGFQQSQAYGVAGKWEHLIHLKNPLKQRLNPEADKT